MMRRAIVILQLMLFRDIVCNDDMRIRERELRATQEKAAKTSIVTYKKAEMTAKQIEDETRRIGQLCNCTVEHLQNVGAFVLSYRSANHLNASNLDLDHSKEVGGEDGIVTVFEEAATSQMTPNDPSFNSQWALANLANAADINAQSGWDEYLSDSNGGSQNGPKVIVAVIDTGVDYNHPDLKNRMWVNPREISGNGLDDDNNGIIDDVYGADFTSGNEGDPMDRHGHGSHCAGIIAAEEDNSLGIAGVASFSQGKVKIMAVKGLNDGGSGSYSGLLKALNYAIGQGAKISSNSWGSTSSMSDSIEELWDNVLRNNVDHLFVTAAGNSNKFVNNNYKPMACGLNEPNLLCVASSTKTDEKSSFSNYGKDFVHVFAPGSAIYSTFLNNGYKNLSGTSMACPHVSGLAALIMTMSSNLKGKEVKELIEENVQNKTAYKDLVRSGGLIDVAKTIKSLKSKENPCEDADVWCVLVRILVGLCDQKGVKEKCPKTCDSCTATTTTQSTTNPTSYMPPSTSESTAPSTTTLLTTSTPTTSATTTPSPSGEDLVCSPGFRQNNWQEYLSSWGSRTGLIKGDTLENRKACWDLAKQNVPAAVGIYFNYKNPYCKAIDNASSIMPWPTSFPNYQDTTSLCILESHIQSA